MPTLKLCDFSDILGVAEDEFPQECINFLNGNHSRFAYRILDGEERDAEILKTIKRIERDTQVVATPDRTRVWQDGWAENLRDFTDSNWDLNSLEPKYFQNGTGATLRWKKQYIKSDNPKFQQDFWTVVRIWLFKTYFASHKTIYEFGCGPGCNLVMLAKMFPEKTIIGLDFVPSAVELVNLLREKAHLPVKGGLFDMIHPDPDFHLDADSVVFTSCSIEQLGNQYGAFIEYLLTQKPALCVHVEPLAEVYDRENLMDYLAYKFHMKRHYPDGLLELIRELESTGKARIMKAKRSFFGCVNHEGYNLIVWKPI